MLSARSALTAVREAAVKRQHAARKYVQSRVALCTATAWMAVADALDADNPRPRGELLVLARTRLLDAAEAMRDVPMFPNIGQHFEEVAAAFAKRYESGDDASA